jgi:hypothetical protein
MTIEAELADGRILEFPDGTKPEVIQGVVKKLVGGGAPAPAAAPAQKGERTWGEALTDLGAGAVSGAGQLFQFPGQLYGLTTGAIKDKDFATTGLQGVGKEMQDWAKAQKSAELKRREAETEKKVREAEKTGGQWAAFKTQLYESATDPMQLGAFLAETAPASIPSIIAALIPGAGPGLAAEVRALQLAARTATTEVAKQAAEQALGVAMKEAAKSAVKRGTAASVGVGAVQQGTDVGVGAYKQVYDTLIAKGVPPEQAAEQTINKARAAGVAGAVISLLAQRLPGAQAMERALAGEKGKLGRVAGAVVGGVKESPGEIFEEVGGKGVQNVAARTVNPEQSLTAGLGQTAAQAGLGGFGMGSTVGALQGRQVPEAPAAPAAPSLSPQTRDADYEPPLFAQTAPQQARQERVAQRTQELAQIIGNEEDAARLAEDEVAAEEERNRKMAAGPTDTAVKTRAQELVASGMEPNQAYAAATQQIADELENDALAKEQGALDVAGTKPKPSRKRTRVASKPGAETTGGPEAPARDGVVPAGADVGLPNAGERLEPGALTESQPVVTEGAPSGTETVEAKQAKAKKQEAPATPVAQGVKVDVAAAAAATDPAEIQKHLADIEAEGATLLSKDGRFPKKGTTKRTRLDELGQLKRQLTEKLAPAPAEETKVEEPVAGGAGTNVSSMVERRQEQIDNEEDRQDEIEFAQLREEARAKVQEKYDRQVKSLWPIVERAKKILRETKYPDSLEAGAVALYIRQLENFVSQYNEVKEGDDFNSALSRLDENAATLPAALKALQESIDALTQEPPKAEKPKRQRKPKAVEEPKADIAIEPEVSPPSKGVVNAFEAAKRRIPMGPSISEQIAEEEAKEKADRKKVKDFEAAEKERKAEEDRIAKEEKATAEEQAAAEAAERDEAAKARAGDVDTVPLEKQIAGALQEIIDSPRFAPGIRKDAKRHLDTITKSAKDPESDAHEAGLEMAYNFVVAQASKPRFMRQGKKPRPSIGRAKVVAIIEAIKARWKNAPEVVVASDINDPVVPVELQAADREAVARGATGVPAGVFHKGKVYIFADQMTSTKDVVEALLHEALGHYGLRGVFGKGLKPILEQVARDFPKEMQALKEKYGLDYSKPKDVAEAAEEILANLAATKPTMGIVQRAIAAVRRALRSIGLDLKLSNNDLIANYILPARSFVEGERVNRAVGGDTSFSRTEEGDEDFDVSEEEVVGAVRSQKEVDLAVKRAEFKFEESAKAQKAAKGVSAAQMAQDPRKALPLVRQMWNRATAAQRRLMVKLPPTSFLVDWVQKEVPQLQATYKLMQKMAGMTNGLLKTAGELTNEIERAFRADPTLRDKLDKITSVATLAEVDPATIDTAERSERLDTLWRELGPEGQRVYKRIRDHFDGLSKYLSKLLDDQVASSNLGVIDQANLMKKIRAVFEQGGKINPYFPLVREGNFWLAMNPNKSKNAADYMFFMAESAAERDNVAREYAADQLRRKVDETEAAWNKRIDDKMKELESDRVFERGDNIQALRDKPYSQGGNKMLTDVFNAIDGMDLGSPNANDALKDSIYQAFLETMPDQAFRKQFIHRKGVAGFRVDVLRNVAHTSAKMATQLARIKYSPMLRNALSAAEDSIAGRLEFEPFVNEMKERVDAAIAPPQQSTASDIANGLNKASFIYYLSGASSALLQPLSIFQTGLPVLSRYGAFNAAKEVAGMMKVWNQVGFHKTNADGTKSWVMPSMEHAKGLTPQQRRAYKAAEAMDLFTATQASAVFNYKATPTDKLRSPKMKLAKGTVDALIFGGLMNTSEKLSREAMFMASFNLNMKEHGNFSRAVDQAVMDTNAALGNYGDYNRPAFMNGLGGKVLTQFMMYPLHTASFLVTNFKTMVAPMGGKDRAEAAQRFFGSLGTTFILAGAAGLPMFSTVMGMLGAAWGQMKDDDWPEDVRDMDFELWFRTKCLDDLLGGLAPVFERGVANAITGVDVAGRTGWGNLFSRDTKETATLREGLTASILEHAGPSANMILSMADGVDAARQGDYAKAVKKWAPAGFRNFINAHELATQGAKDNKGAQVLAKDSFNTGLLIGQSIGFRSDLLTNTQYVAFKVIGLEKRILNERTQILNNLDREYRNGNSAGYVKYLKERQEFNNRYPTYEITPDNVADSLETRAEQRATSWRGVLPSEKNVGVFAPVLAPALRAAAKAEEEGRKK